MPAFLASSQQSVTFKGRRHNSCQCLAAGFLGNFEYKCVHKVHMGAMVWHVAARTAGMPQGFGGGKPPMH